MKRIVLFVAAMTASASATASDFSRLAEPSFARTMLLGPKRSMEAQCAALALADARLHRSMTAADAEAIAAEIAKPLTIEIGDAKQARELVDGNKFGPREYDDAQSAQQRFVVMDQVEQLCAPLFDAFRGDGVAALQAKLLPERGLIPLLSLPECVAIAEASSRTDKYSPYDQETLAELKALASQGGTAKEIADRESDILAARARIAANPQEPDAYTVRGVACFATFAEHAKAVRSAGGN